MADPSPLPRWQSHKIVRAAKIKKIEGMRLDLDIGEGKSHMVIAAAGMFARYQPIVGDYYVVYDDGYASISPQQAFEAGYHAL